VAGLPIGEAAQDAARQAESGRVAAGLPEVEAAVDEVLGDGAAGAQEALHRLVDGRGEVALAPFGHECGRVGGGVMAQGAVK